MAAATANFRLIDELMKNKDILPKELNKDLAKFAADGAKLLGKASADLSLVRKMLVKGQLDNKYGVLCSQRCYTKNLFGNDLNQALKEADDMSKLTRTITRPLVANRPFNRQYGNKPATLAKPKDRFLYQRNRGQSQQRQQYYHNVPYQPQQQAPRFQSKSKKANYGQNQKA